MRILIAGNMGYLGPVLVDHLRRRFPGAVLLGYDSGFFADCLTGAAFFPENSLNAQYFGDLRDMPAEILRDVDAIVNLAAVSNDPMGHRFEKVTEAINQNAGLRLATLAAAAGVKNFVFASSCSVYGSAEDSPRKETDSTTPLTAYARSKIGTEDNLRKLDAKDMTVTCLRFATACGYSPRLRLDLVLNDFVACALAKQEITVLSDGTPWRPLIAVADMARAIEWAIQRESGQGGRCLIVNTGSDSWNFQVKDLAQAVANAVPGTRVSINAAAPPDKRSYQVDFGLFKELAPEYQPEETIEKTIKDLRSRLHDMRFADPDFRSSRYMRLKVLEDHLSANRLNEELRWNKLS